MEKGREKGDKQAEEKAEVIMDWCRGALKLIILGLMLGTVVALFL